MPDIWEHWSWAHKPFIYIYIFFKLYRMALQYNCSKLNLLMESTKWTWMSDPVVILYLKQREEHPSSFIGKNNDLKYEMGSKYFHHRQNIHLCISLLLFLGEKSYKSKCSRYPYWWCVKNGKQWVGVWRERTHLIHSSYPCEVKKKIDCGLLVFSNKHSSSAYWKQLILVESMVQ